MVRSVSLAEAVLCGLDFLLEASLEGPLGLSEDTLGRVLQERLLAVVGSSRARSPSHR